MTTSPPAQRRIRCSCTEGPRGLCAPCESAAIASLSDAATTLLSSDTPEVVTATRMILECSLSLQRFLQAKVEFTRLQKEASSFGPASAAAKPKRSAQAQAAPQPAAEPQPQPTASAV